MRYMTLLAACLILAIHGNGAAQDQKTPEPRPVQVPRDQEGFGRFVADQVIAALPVAAVRIDTPLVLTLTLPGFAGEQQLPLARIWDYCQRNDSSCAATVGTYASDIAATAQAQGQGIDPARVRAVIRDRAFVDSSRKALAGTAPGGKDADIVAAPFTGDLWTVLVVEYPTGSTILQKSDLATLKLGPDEAMALARRNLAALLPPLSSLARRYLDGPVMFAIGGPYESSRLLLPETWAQVAKENGGKLVATAPGRDIVAYVQGDSKGDAVALRQFVQKTRQSQKYPVTSAVLRWTPEGWQAVE